MESDGRWELSDRREILPSGFMPRGVEAKSKKSKWAIDKVICLNKENVTSLYMPYTPSTKEGATIEAVMNIAE